ncbi:flagellar biosynthesis repressor FlbT [Bartonella ancashensis]|uniref:Flagellar basal-body rod modification protein FlgD n=1 Tax=Bartonella ancashensis TaxID=1318743 RepID=A0A0M4L600_9HYPH|nr:flagellar biosynthesis repressor FlbT [Bartonella ancashensis]ALE02946.1 Flagellar basal-body rod modification protein FlgD [Bartonella ancashensis]
MYLTLKPNEKIFLNGAVLRVDRKVTFELLNDATFLLEGHVLQVEDTDTPLKQLYFSAQLILINPEEAKQALAVFVELLKKTFTNFYGSRSFGRVKRVYLPDRKNKVFEILKVIRGLFQKEAKVIEKMLTSDINTTADVNVRNIEMQY